MLPYVSVVNSSQSGSGVDFSCRRLRTKVVPESALVLHASDKDSRDIGWAVKAECRESVHVAPAWKMLDVDAFGLDFGRLISKLYRVCPELVEFGFDHLVFIAAEPVGYRLGTYFVGIGYVVERIGWVEVGDPAYR